MNEAELGEWRTKYRKATPRGKRMIEILIKRIKAIKEQEEKIKIFLKEANV